MKYLINSKVEKTWQDKKFYEVVLLTPDEKEIKLSCWKGEADGKNVNDEWEVELEEYEKNGYKNWKVKSTTPKGKPNMDRIMEKKADSIAMSQDKKAQNIAQAQDRSAWMWAKNNASSLIANQKPSAMDIRSLDEIADMVLDLATKIYNGEPTSPFNG